MTTVEEVPPEAAAGMADQLREVYAEVYAEPPYGYGPDDAAEFLVRYAQQSVRPGFRLVTAVDGDELVGFSYGLTFGEGTWWRGALDDPPEEIRAAEKFAVIELVVRGPYRGQGVGRRLLDTLLAARPEPWAILVATTAAPARRIYAHWGWQQVGTVQSYPHWPVDEALALPLRPAETP